jgi:hypothetical protein
MDPSHERTTMLALCRLKAIAQDRQTKKDATWKAIQIAPPSSMLPAHQRVVDSSR